MTELYNRLPESAPKLFTKSVFFELVVVVTIAPKYLAIWIANVPTPPEPAWIKTLSPRLISPFVTQGLPSCKSGKWDRSCIYMAHIFRL